MNNSYVGFEKAKAPVEIIPVDAHTVSRVRNLNSVLFPVRYSAGFYKRLVQPGQFAQVALYQGVCVGTIACRTQPLGFAESMVDGAPQTEMYMMTLGVLAPYRRLGIGKMLLANAVRAAQQDPLARRIVLHVKIDNDDALRFYHRHGFATVRLVENYYKNIEPPHAYLLECRLR
ncbi:hypothetical protein GGI25_000063 [Coemansia spiralis]|uniref:N-acetyltransferase domain-containing protein n=2 Tax=Coemansia TaxID=4863 RepID=A0A9W8GDC2_9FUNG|nr:hypothetical protein EDC05_002708 [Coemansia umbellata]KAJ2623058.1 hypothetical protein GGI26_002667 [Coemansia sp. RSA 1358]KAJ2681108.1 hypothetical protein GGI25_000063 [Coemansia spiralis]